MDLTNTAETWGHKQVFLKNAMISQILSGRTRFAKHRFASKTLLVEFSSHSFSLKEIKYFSVNNISHFKVNDVRLQPYRYEHYEV